MRTLLLAAICAVLLTTLAWADPATMPLDEIRPGMKGVMKTVIQGTEPEDIPVEIIDVVRKFEPGRNMILVRLEGEKAKRLGVARGMSGSPVYIGGRLIGAMAMTWSFVREPIGGVTPIESMTTVWKGEGKDADAQDVATWKPGETLPSEQLINELLYPTPALPILSPASMRPIQTPLNVRGMSKGAMNQLADQLRAFDIMVVDGPGGGEVVNVPKDLKLVPGGSLCVQVIRGDFDASGTGTVTEVRGNRFWGFGHPMFNNGPVRYPVATGYIHAIIPSDQSSFKVASTVKTVGTLWIDQESAVAGEIGPVPDLAKLTVDVKRRDLVGDAHFNFEVVKDPRMMLSFVGAALNGSLDISGQAGAQVKVDVDAVIDIEGYDPVRIHDVFGGPQAGMQAIDAFVNPVGQILHNPYGRVNITGMHLTTEVHPGDPRAVIRLVETDKSDYYPDDEIDLAVTLQPYRGKQFVRHFKIKVPHDTPEGALSIMVCDAMTDTRLDSRERPHRFRPEDAAGVIDFFRRGHPNTDLVLRVSRDSTGVAVKGREMPRLPDSVVSVLGKQPSTEVSNFSEPIVRRESTEFVLMGSQQLQVNVLKRP